MSHYVEDDMGLLEESQGAFAPEILPDLGVVYSRRWSRKLEDGTWEVLTYYATAGREDHGEEERNTPPFHVAIRKETTYCTNPADPGGTEFDSDYFWSEFGEFPTVEEALEAALQEVQGWEP